MTKTTAIAIQIATGDARPIFKQIVDGIRKEIATGKISVGAKLPSVRALAMQLTINANTVAKAYSELTSLGALESRKGLGVFVTEQEQRLSQGEQDKRLRDASQKFITEVMHLDYSAEEMTKYLLLELNKLNIR